MATQPLPLKTRDIDILEALATHRGLTAEQISRLFFPPTVTRNKQGEVVMAGRDPDKTKVSKYARAKLNKFVEDGLIFPHPLYRGGPSLYALDTKGAKLLSQLRELPPELVKISRHDHTELAVSIDYALHILQSNDVRIAIEQSAATHGFMLTTWFDEKTLRATHPQDKVTVLVNETRITKAPIPDGYFVLETKERPFSHFLELDRKTETVKSSSNLGKDWATKIAVYLAYYRRAGRDLPSLYEKRYGTAKGRVLTVTTGEGRLASLKRVTEEVGGKERFWFTTFARIQEADILTDPLWSVASKSILERLIWEETTD